MPKKPFPVRVTAAGHPFRCALDFNERPHDYHAMCRVDPYEVPVTVEKPVSPEELQRITAFLERQAQGLVVHSLALARARRATLGVTVEADHSDPRIHVQGDVIHVNGVIRAEEGGDDVSVDVEFTPTGDPMAEPGTR